MPKIAKMEEVLAMAGAIGRGLIAVDGLPCAGKSTLSNHISATHGYDRIGVDDFLLPESQWPSRNAAAFPFQFMRYDALINAVRSLATTGVCTYAPFDWATLSVSPQKRIVSLKRAVVVEGVSTLHADLCDFYNLRIFVESDRASLLDSSRARGLGIWAEAWEKLFVPSADVYMRTRPQDRADLIFAGRGVNGTSLGKTL
jgi:uridine kinase